MHLNGEQLTFLARFSKSPDAGPLLRVLQARLDEREAKLRTSVGEEVYRQQGRALELDEIIADITEAQTKLNRTAATAPPRFAAVREQGNRV